jgi:nucleoprotein TPR
LTDRLAVAKDLLAATNQELSNVRETHAEELSATRAEKAKLESTIQEMSKSETRLMEIQTELKKDLEQQANITKDAQSNYEKELLKHADAASGLQKMRAEVGQLKEQVIELSAKAENSASQLAAGESSWGSQKYVYEHEIEQVKSRCSDLSSQNNALLEQLERISSRVSRVSDQNVEGTDEASDDKSREIISYLRREKEIVECNLDVSQQEVRRIKQRLDHTTAALDEAKLDLQKERKREDEALNIAAEHSKVMKQLEDLNVLRESNSSLRHQSNYYMNKSQELETELNTLKSRVEPLEEQIRELAAESEAKDQQIKLVQDDNEKWKKRAEQILQKYQRIDPEELKALQNEVEALKLKVENLTKERDELQAQVSHGTDLESKYNDLQETSSKTAEELDTLTKRFDRLLSESQAKLKMRRVEAVELKAEVERLNQLVADRNKQLEAAQSAGGALAASNESQEVVLNAELDQTKLALAAAKSQISEKTQRVADLESQVNTLSDKILELQTAGGADSSDSGLASLRAELDQTKLALESAKSQAESTVKEREKRILELETEINTLSNRVLELQSSEKLSENEAGAKITELSAIKATLETQMTSLQQEVETLRTQLTHTVSAEEHEKKLEELRSSLANVSAGELNVANLDEQKKKWTEEAEKSALAKYKVNIGKKLKDIKLELEAEFKKREQELRNQLTASGVRGDQTEALASLKRQHEEQLEALKEAHSKGLAAAARDAREAAKKEFEMRGKLLQAKAEKAVKDKEALALQIRRLKGGEDVPTAAVPGAGTTTIPRPTVARVIAGAAGQQSSIPVPRTVRQGSMGAGRGIALQRPQLQRPGIIKPTADVSSVKRQLPEEATEQGQKRRKEGGE